MCLLLEERHTLLLIILLLLLMFVIQFSKRDIFPQNNFDTFYNFPFCHFVQEVNESIINILIYKMAE